LGINKIAIAYKAILMISITIKYRADESLVISIVSYRLYFIIYGRAKEISYFIEILLTDFFVNAPYPVPFLSFEKLR